MTSASSRDALIVGAGIGGLAAAISLQRAGWRVRVLERAASPRELGFALLLAPNAVHALRALGVADAVVAGGIVATGGEMRRADGTLLRRFDLDRVRDLLPEPTVMVLRPVLLGALLNALPSDALLLGSEVAGFDADAGGVDLRLRSGARVRGDLLVGADGVGSVVRRHLHPAEPPPRASGLFGLRGVAHDAARHMGGSSGAQYFGRGVEAGLGLAGGSTVYWYLSLPGDVVAGAARDPVRVLARVLPGFDARFRAIASATAPDDMRLDELVDRDPLSAWGRGPVTLLGDAAHPMLPHAGQGAAQALEDAVALGRSLAGAADIDPALRVYERRRTARTAAIVRLARRNARMGSVNNPLGVALRDLALRLIPERMILKQIVAMGSPVE